MRSLIDLEREYEESLERSRRRRAANANLLPHTLREWVGVLAIVAAVLLFLLLLKALTA